MLSKTLLYRRVAVCTILIAWSLVAGMWPSTAVAQEPIVFDFDNGQATPTELSKGHLVDSITLNGLKMDISVRRHKGGGDYDDWRAMIFDTSEPGKESTGGDDDLGSPNKECEPKDKGPGNGSGGEPNTPGENCVAQENVLIIPENQLDEIPAPVPDDAANGGTITFSFGEPVQVTTIGILDFDEDELGINYYDATNAPIGQTVTTTVEGHGENSYLEIKVNDAIDAERRDETTKVEIILPGSGAIAHIAVIPRGPSTINGIVWDDTFTPNGLREDPVSEPGIASVPVQLLDSSGLLITHTQTSRTGFYSFTNLFSGTYQIQVGLAFGFVFSPQAEDGSVVDANGRSPLIELKANDAHPVRAGMYLRSPTRSAAIKGLVWHDRDRNRQQDPGEEGFQKWIGGEPVVRLTLFHGNSCGSNSPPDPQNDFLDTMPALPNGEYVFESLEAGTYRLGLTLTAGYLPTTELDPLAEDSNTWITKNCIDLPADTIEHGWNFGVYHPDTQPPGSIGNFVWHDIDQQGDQDPDEPGKPNVLVELFDGDPESAEDSDIELQSQRTDEHGHYHFLDVKDGNYYIRATLPSGYRFTIHEATGNDQTDSDIILDASKNITGFTPRIMLGTSQVITTEDVGMYWSGIEGKASVNGWVWHDINDNGLQDEREGFASVAVALINCDTGETITTTRTTMSGHYEFRDLEPSNENHGIQVTPPLGDYIFSLPDVGDDDDIDSDVDANGHSTTCFPLVDDTNQDQDAGIVPSGSISGLAWNDTRTPDGIREVGYLPYEGVIVELEKESQIVQTTRTMTDGAYLFRGLRKGQYQVKFVPPANYRFSPKDVASAGDDRDSDADLTNGTSDSFRLEIGHVRTRIDAGLILQDIPPLPPSSLGNRIWIDTNRDGKQDPDEWRGLTDVPLSLTFCNGDPVSPPRAAQSDANGYYRFEGLKAGSYKIQVDLTGFDYTFSQADVENNNLDKIDSDAVPLVDNERIGLMPASPIGCIELGPNSNDRSWDVGVYSTKEPPTSSFSIGDRVWRDRNMNGRQDPGEEGVSDVRVHLLEATGAGIQTKTTDANGNYKFTINDPPSPYRIQVELPNGYVFSPPNKVIDGVNDDSRDSDVDPVTGISEEFTPLAGLPNNNWDVGMYIDPPIPPNTSTIGNRVWLDKEDRNHVQDDNEPGLGGVQVNLFSGCDNPQFMRSDITDAGGYYSFVGLSFAAGQNDYQLQVVRPSNYVFSQPNIGSDDHVDSDIVDLVNGWSECITLPTNTAVITSSWDIGLFLPTAAITMEKKIQWLSFDEEGNRILNEVGVDNPRADNIPLIDPGTPITWTFDVANTGEVTLTNIVITDTLGLVIDCVSLLAVDESKRCTASSEAQDLRDSIDGIVDGRCERVASHPLLGNSARVMALTPLSRSIIATDTAYYCNTPFSQISVTKIARQPRIHKGQTAFFDVSVFNTGNTILRNVQLDDDQVQDCDRSLSRLAVGGAFPYTCSQMDVPSTFTNTIVAKADGPREDDKAEDTASTQILVFDPDFELNVTVAPQPIRSGGKVTFTVQVTNSGDSLLTDVRIRDSLNTDCDRNQNALDSGEPFGLYTCQSPPIGATTANVFTVEGYSPVPARITKPTSVPINIIDPSISVTQAVMSSTAIISNVVPVTVTLFNTGDTLLRQVSVSNSEFTDCNREEIELAVGMSVEIACVTDPLAVSTTNVVTATGIPTDNKAVQDRDAISITVIEPFLAIHKIADRNEALFNDAVQFTILITNTGDTTMPITVTDTAFTQPITTSYVLTAEKVFSYTYSRVMSDTLATPYVYTNTATVVGSPPEVSDKILRTNTVSLTVVSAKLDISSAPELTMVLPNSQVTFTVWITNVGTIEITDLAVNGTGESTCSGEQTTIPIDESVVYTCIAEASEETEAPIQTFAHTVTASGESAAGPPANVSHTSTVKVIHPRISITKEPNKSEIVSGDSVNYTISIYNYDQNRLSDVTLDNIQVSDLVTSDCNRLPGELGELTLGSTRPITYTCIQSDVRADITSTVVVTALSPINSIVTATTSASIDVFSPTIKVDVAPITEVIEINTMPSVVFTLTNDGDVNHLSTQIQVSAVGPQNKTLACQELYPSGPLEISESKSFTCTLNTISVTGTVGIDVFVTAMPRVGSMISDTNRTTIAVDVGHIAVNLEPEVQNVNENTDATLMMSIHNTGPFPLYDVNYTFVIDRDIAITCSLVEPIPDVPLPPDERLQYTCLLPAGFESEEFNIMSKVAVSGRTKKGYVARGGAQATVVVKVGKIELASLINGRSVPLDTDADSMRVPENEEIRWTYILTNSGGISFTWGSEGLTITDSVAGSVSLAERVPSRAGNGDDILAPGEVWVFERKSPGLDLHVLGNGGFCDRYRLRQSYANVVQTWAVGDHTDTDISYYCNPPMPAIQVEKRTKGTLSPASHSANDPFDADVPIIDAGEQVQWTYIVTNSGESVFSLNDLFIQDDRYPELAISQAYMPVKTGLPNTFGIVDDDLFEPGEIWLYTKWDMATQLSDTPSVTVDGCNRGTPYAAYQNTVMVTAVGVNESTSSHYCNPTGIELTMLTNGVRTEHGFDTDVPKIRPGDPVIWTYIITNTGQVPFDENSVRITDTVHGLITASDITLRQGDDDSLFEPGESWIYQKRSGNITALDLRDGKALPPNVAITTGCYRKTTDRVYPVYQARAYASIPNASAQAVSHYCNSIVHVTLTTKTNGYPANHENDSDVPHLEVGEKEVVTWQYEVRNSGEITLTEDNLTVVDIQTVPGPIRRQEIDERVDNKLSPNETWVYETSAPVLKLTEDLTQIKGCNYGDIGIARPTYRNTGWVTATVESTLSPSSSHNNSHYCNPADIKIELTINGQIADEPNASDIPEYKPGTPITWTYQITNTGTADYPLASMVLSDTVGHLIALSVTNDPNGNGLLEPDESWSIPLTKTAGLTPTVALTLPIPGFTVEGCDKRGTGLTRATYENVATIVVKDDDGNVIAHDDDPAYYCNPPLIQLEKLTNGADADLFDEPNVPELLADGEITWTYLLTNNGTERFAKNEIVITDSDPDINIPNKPESSSAPNDDFRFLDPGETWTYIAKGKALDLFNTFPNQRVSPCDTRDPGNIQPTYYNLATVTVPDASDSDCSHYRTPLTVTVTVSDSVQDVGLPHRINIEVTDDIPGSRESIPNQEVEVTISNADQIVRTVTTGADGRASFLYTRTQTSQIPTDTITAKIIPISPQMKRFGSPTATTKALWQLIEIEILTVQGEVSVSGQSNVTVIVRNRVDGAGVPSLRVKMEARENGGRSCSEGVTQDVTGEDDVQDIGKLTMSFARVLAGSPFGQAINCPDDEPRVAAASISAFNALNQTQESTQINNLFIIAWVDLDGNATPDDNEPQAIFQVVTETDVVGFRADSQDGGVLIRWQSFRERGIAGFDLYGMNEDGEAKKINSKLLTSGSEHWENGLYRYHYFPETSIPTKYQLVIHMANGNKEYREAILDAKLEQIFLPFVSRNEPYLYHSEGTAPTRYQLGVYIADGDKKYHESILDEESSQVFLPFMQH
ncbi:MAG: SdrD B-like domain-containing protein [Chloroflexota bacterium]